MRPLLRSLAMLLTASCLAAATGAAWAQQSAGRFLSVTGEVSVLGRDGQTRAATQGSQIHAGETVVTGDNALAQMRMADSSLISVRSASEFKLEEFAYAGNNDSNASFVVSILKGGFRTITGLIAQSNRRGYRISTPAATIGVRGTHFEVVHVQPQLAVTGAPAGTYNHVYDGITTMQNPGGATLLVNREQTAFAGLQPGVAPMLVAPPAAIFGRPTPVPRAAAPQPQPAQAGGRPAQQGPGAVAPREGIAGQKVPAIRDGAILREATTPVLREAAPALTPIDASRTTTLTPLAPTTTLQPATTTTSPLDVTRTISPTLTIEPSTTLTPLDTSRTTTIQQPTTTILQQPVTTTIQQPATTILQQPVTTTIQQPTTILQQPATTTIQQPTTTIKQPTTISPILTR